MAPVPFGRFMVPVAPGRPIVVDPELPMVPVFGLPPMLVLLGLLPMVGVSGRFTVFVFGRFPMVVLGLVFVGV
jgi:hypothetical protein